MNILSHLESETLCVRYGEAVGGLQVAVHDVRHVQELHRVRDLPQFVLWSQDVEDVESARDHIWRGLTDPAFSRYQPRPVSFPPWYRPAHTSQPL